jgi:outer membrane protein assembly factor BamA
MDKWAMLQRSGLFSNLTARVLHNNGEVKVYISGAELPSSRFSPELSVSTSVTNPELCGGVCFEDRNFCGLGQYLEIFFARKEGQDERVKNLPPQLRVTWKDFSIGQSSKTSVLFEETHSYEDISDISPAFSTVGMHPNEVRDFSTKNPVRTAIKKFWVNFKG